MLLFDVNQVDVDERISRWWWCDSNKDDIDAGEEDSAELITCSIVYISEEPQGRQSVSVTQHSTGKS